VANDGLTQIAYKSRGGQFEDVMGKFQSCGVSLLFKRTKVSSTWQFVSQNAV